MASPSHRCHKPMHMRHVFGVHAVSMACMLVMAMVMMPLTQAHYGPPTNLTVSGISSGGYMAVQFHVAFSSVVDAAGVVAGGPYYSSQGNVITALTSMEDPSVINLALIRTQMDAAASMLSIDSPSNLAGSNAWLFAGTNDVTVYPGVGKLLADQYRSLGVNLTTVFDVPAAHAFPTDHWGNPCNYTGPLYINNCGLDAAKEILLNAYPHLRRSWKPHVPPVAGNLIAIKQTAYIPTQYALIDPELMGLQQIAYGYFPASCQKSRNSCPVHIVFHGCRQTLDHLGIQFIEHTGYLRWAEANNIILLFPQSRMNYLNPKGCFDWWGFSGTAFATKLGPQMGTTYNMALAARDYPSIRRASAALVAEVMNRKTKEEDIKPPSKLQRVRSSVADVTLNIPGL